MGFSYLPTYLPTHNLWVDQNIASPPSVENGSIVPFSTHHPSSSLMVITFQERLRVKAGRGETGLASQIVK